MAEGTLTRGRLTTAPDMWGLAEARRRPLYVCLLIAILLHLPAIPSHFSIWIQMLFGSEEETTGPQQEVVIPIELDIDDEPGRQPDESGGSADPDEKSTEKSEPDEDLSLEDFDDDDDDAAKPDAGVEEEHDAGLPDGGVAEAPEEPAGGPIQDPFEAAGNATGFSAEHPNVRIYIAADVLRQRAELSAMFGDLLASVPEWTDLLGGTKLDPIKDFDHLLISGPQLRNPRWIVATIEYNVASSRIRSAVDQVVKKSPNGKWLEDQDLPVAQIGADGERRVVLVPDKRLLVVLPVEAEAQISRLKDIKPFKKSSKTGIGVYIITPSRAFKSGPLTMPQSVKWMRIRFTLEGAEDFFVEVEAEDESAQAAAEHARKLEGALESVRSVTIPIVGKKEFIGKPTWELDGARMRMRAPATKEQVRRIMRLIKEVVLPPLIAKRNKASPPASASAKGSLPKPPKNKPAPEKQPPPSQTSGDENP